MDILDDCRVSKIMFYIEFINARAFPSSKYLPDETPTTISKDHTSLTVDINPKVRAIRKNVPLTWDVNIRMEVLDDFKVSMITLYLECARASLTDGPVEIKDSSGNVVGTMEFWRTDEFSRVYYDLYSTTVYRGSVTTDQYFKKGDYFSIHFSLYSDTEGVRGRGIYLFFLKKTTDGSVPATTAEIGLCTNFLWMNDPYVPQFPIPELPLGTLAALAASLLALKFRKSRA